MTATVMVPMAPAAKAWIAAADGSRAGKGYWSSVNEILHEELANGTDSSGY